jgi:hypothetical protein
VVTQRPERASNVDLKPRYLSTIVESWVVPDLLAEPGGFEPRFAGLGEGCGWRTGMLAAAGVRSVGL